MNDWHPSPKQRRVMEAALEEGLSRNITAICLEAGVSRKSFYGWLKSDAEFRAAWGGLWRTALERHIPGVVAAVIRQAQDGDVPAARLIADMAGMVKRQNKVETWQDELLALVREGRITLQQAREFLGADLAVDFFARIGAVVVGDPAHTPPGDDE